MNESLEACQGGVAGWWAGAVLHAWESRAGLALCNCQLAGSHAVGLVLLLQHPKRFEGVKRLWGPKVLSVMAGSPPHRTFVQLPPRLHLYRMLCAPLLRPAKLCTARTCPQSIPYFAVPRGPALRRMPAARPPLPHLSRLSCAWRVNTPSPHPAVPRSAASSSCWRILTATSARAEPAWRSTMRGGGGSARWRTC